jgi:hypothetical protein
MTSPATAAVSERYDNNDAFNSRPPSPPRIYIPPPRVDEQGQSSSLFRIDVNTSITNPYVTAEFCAKVKHESLSITSRALDWQYSERSRAQAV